MKAIEAMPDIVYFGRSQNITYNNHNYNRRFCFKFWKMQVTGVKEL